MMGLLVGKKNGMYGRKRTNEEKEKISNTRKERGCGVGQKNPMYNKNARLLTSPEKIKLADEKRRKWTTGRVHMHNDSLRKNILVTKDEIMYYESIGYKQGQGMYTLRKSIKGVVRMYDPATLKNYTLRTDEEVKEFLNKGFKFGRCTGNKAPNIRTQLNRKYFNDLMIKYNININEYLGNNI